MLVSPINDVPALTWAHTVADDLPKDLKRIMPPSAPGTLGPGTEPASQQMALVGTVGTGTVSLRYPGSGYWRHAQSPGSNVHWLWGSAADLLLHGDLRMRLAFGNPVIAMRFSKLIDASSDKGAKEGVLRGDQVKLGDTFITTSKLTIVAYAPGAPGLDTLSVLRYLADAFDTAGMSLGMPTWQDFVRSPSLSALESPLRLLEPGGSPATGRSISMVGGIGPVTLAPSHRGDVLTALGISRADLAAGATLDVSSGGSPVAFAEGTSYPNGQVPLTDTSTLVTAATLEDWLSPQQSTVLTRFSRGNTVRAFVDGHATFADLFDELDDAVAAGPVGAFYVTGYSLQHDAKLMPQGAPRRTVAEVAQAMATAGGDPRFLALQMLQLNPGWIRDAQTVTAIIAALLMIGGVVGTVLQKDSNANQVSFFVHAQMIAIAVFFGAISLDDLLDSFELNRDSIDALAAMPGVEAHLDPVDADVDDNPLASTSGVILPAAIAAQRHFNVFHQKIQVVRNTRGIHVYCGGIDLNANRTQTPEHAGRSPFHDVHARVNGPATGELVTTFIERWQRASTTTLALEAPGALDGLPTDGPDIVQIARTYYRHKPDSGRGFTTFSPNGESTILKTLITAVGQARRYIYIEDQYLTPPPDLTKALADAAASVSGPLIIAVPASPDQPFGLLHRKQFIDAMRTTWGDRVKVGILQKRFSHASTTFESASGRLWLFNAINKTDDSIELAPIDRVPATPFWLTVGNEVMRADSKVLGTSSPDFVQFHVVRGSKTRLFSATKGTSRAAHKKLAPVLAGSFPSIYVHAKMMLIDDAFASIGSANANRRGHYSDGETNIMAMREAITDGDNWIRDLRIDLWAEHLGLTPEYAAVALRDPTAAIELFDRKFTVGNRFTTFDAQPYTSEGALKTEFDDKTSALGIAIGAGTLVAGIGAGMIVGSEAEGIFNTIVDPSSYLEEL